MGIITKYLIYKMTIDYYGKDANYIHLKFGDARKCYNFTDEFRKEFPEFTERYTDYWNNGASKEHNKGFKSPFEVVAYAFKKNIPVNWYYNYTDTPVSDYDEIIKYLVDENTYIHD